jgi:hypothetical protein
MFLVELLTIPAVTAVRSNDTSPSLWGNVTVAAKGKPHHGHNNKDKRNKHKKHEQAAGPGVPGNSTVRQSVTQTFTSAVPMAIPNRAPNNATEGPGTPYPSAIDVSGFTNGSISDVNLILSDFTHGFSADADFLLTSADGRRALVMSDAGNNLVVSIDLTLDDEAAAPLPETDLSDGTFQPTDIDFNETVDGFAAPAPAPDGSVALSTFDGADPNGTWQLWVTDDDKGDFGAMSGWALEITAEVDVQVPEQVAVAPQAKQQDRGPRRRTGHGEGKGHILSGTDRKRLQPA